MSALVHAPASGSSSGPGSGPGRKRGVSTCLPCYNKKQKCNRQYPCNHCARRRRPEQCTYVYHDQRKAPAAAAAAATAQAAQAAAAPKKMPPPSVNQNQFHEIQLFGSSGMGFAVDSEGQPAMLEPSNSCGTALREDHTTPLSELFGYFEDSESNTLGLLRRVAGLDQRKHNHQTVLSREVGASVLAEMERMPPRTVIDFLMQFFLAEVNWMFHLVHPASLMSHYEAWWNKRRQIKLPDTDVECVFNATDIDFAALILRICAFAAQFLPSASHTIDSVRGMPLAKIREACGEVASALGGIAVDIDSRGSLFRVQHVCFSGLTAGCEGHIRKAWTTLCSAVCLAQGLGFHQDARGDQSLLLDELEYEMRRRVFCNLYVWDGLLSRQLDHVPFLNVSLNVDNLPKMNLTTGTDPDSGAPEGFTERVLQARLVAFWRDCKPSESRGAEYDPTRAQERYERFRREFIDTLPPAFALEPSLEWDRQLPHLSMQRQLLYTAIFDSICHNFRPLLLLEPAYIRRLPAYKQVLLSSQGAILAHSALKVLECVSTLSGMLGATYTRLVAIIFHTFEAGALLLCLCIRGTVQDGDHLHQAEAALAETTGTAGAMEMNVTRRQCVQAAREALVRLELLGEVSDMAEAGACSLAQLMRQLDGHGGGEDALILYSTASSLPSEKEVDEQNRTPPELEEFWPESGCSDTIMNMGSSITFAKMNCTYFDGSQMGDLGDILLEEGMQGWDAG
ncbi:hypothetical protein SODALDRAFT_291188 [Sodiomyces alkalinus F11]|uniref:Zn(2)-C6 fungal-type domain-containing protein n=1 Tax=Sodiomyces alkalinus (strain CBS 110278 / VKM F-3762 / F11) TaxID=1314773 RepID=A0A3N2Q210_SODAK|nr:hypothetical protein SODALDRAFT_291188 [Sodiomyces alkalinus F11]ROT40787.1 hypothetical protein SODALDRAFT_291188 [Sodiomyces alkalinus F11]